MAKTRGREETRRFMAALPADLEKKVLRGAARAAGDVVADEARERVISDDTQAAIVVQRRSEPGQIKVRITVKPGWGRSVGFWLEYGTDPHFMSVAAEQSGGRSVQRINKTGAMLIGGNFAATVHHPGAAAHPFLRPALDLKGKDAVAAAQSYINARVKRSGIVATEEPEGDDQ